MRDTHTMVAYRPIRGETQRGQALSLILHEFRKTNTTNIYRHQRCTTYTLRDLDFDTKITTQCTTKPPKWCHNQLFNKAHLHARQGQFTRTFNDFTTAEQSQDALKR